MSGSGAEGNTMNHDQAQLSSSFKISVDPNPFSEPDPLSNLTGLDTHAPTPFTTQNQV